MEYVFGKVLLNDRKAKYVPSLAADIAICYANCS
jgi:hypothetical protein